MTWTSYQRLAYLLQGSTRSGILGEATVNMADYLSSKASVPILLPLKKCNYGSILQVRLNFQVLLLSFIKQHLLVVFPARLV